MYAPAREYLKRKTEGGPELYVTAAADERWPPQSWQLRTRADTGDGEAAYQLAGLLAEHGNLSEAVQLL